MDRDLIDSLFARYREPVYRFLRRMLRDGPAAEDLTQETFLRAMNGRYQANGHERAWIFQIARNLARDRARAHSYVVNFKPFFQGHRVTLIVQARKQE